MADSLLDTRFEYLRARGHTGATNDMLLAWLKANGASTANQLGDAWDGMLTSKGYAGQRNDMWYALLGDVGHTGTLNDREVAFWKAGQNLPAAAHFTPRKLRDFLISRGWAVVMTYDGSAVFTITTASDPILEDSEAEVHVFLWEDVMNRDYDFLPIRLQADIAEHMGHDVDFTAVGLQDRLLAEGWECMLIDEEFTVIFDEEAYLWTWEQVLSDAYDHLPMPLHADIDQYMGR